jgi:hypothetical protein
MRAASRGAARDGDVPALASGKASADEVDRVRGWTMPNNLIMIVLDSCRYDSMVQAVTPNLDRIGKPERRWSYASWTAPSHYAFMMGLTPHASPQHVYASEIYKQEFTSWADRLGLPDLKFETFIPQLSLPKVLKDEGYRCVGRVSMPVLNGFTLINRFFDDYKLMPNHNDFAGMVDDIAFSADQPSFYFLNLGETHYPYMLEGKDLPYIPGVHGALRSLAEGQDAGGSLHAGNGASGNGFFDGEVMRHLHRQQVKCVEYVDSLIGALYDKAPPETHFMVMSDHGDAFGEGGFFGHGPVMHEKVFEVPFIEGRRH